MNDKREEIEDEDLLEDDLEDDLDRAYDELAEADKKTIDKLRDEHGRIWFVDTDMGLLVVAKVKGPMGRKLYYKMQRDLNDSKRDQGITAENFALAHVVFPPDKSAAKDILVEYPANSFRALGALGEMYQGGGKNLGKRSKRGAATSS